MLSEPTNTSWVPVMPVAPAVLPRFDTPADIAPAPRFGAEMVMVPDAPFSDWLNVMLFPPANTNLTWPPDAMPVVPLVLPTFDMPMLCDSTVWLNALIVTVPDAPFRLCESVTLLPPARTQRTWAPEATPVVPDVLPTLLMPIDCDSADWAGT